MTVRCALRLAPLVFVRPGELRHAEWSHIDLDAGEWRYPVTKTQTPHIVPLSAQAVAILRELQPLTGRGRYVFASARSSQRPMSDNAILAAMRRMGIAKDEMSGHGFRAMARARFWTKYWVSGRISSSINSRTLSVIRTGALTTEQPTWRSVAR